MKIIAFVNGDSYSMKTWSNVPYFFLKTLEENGVVVYRCNVRLQDENRMMAWLGHFFNNKIRLGFRLRDFCLEQTKFYRRMVRRKMLKCVQKHPGVDLLMSFDFNSSVAEQTQMSTLLFSDWTLDYLVRKLHHRRPNLLEKCAIRRQEKTLKEADYVVTLFPNVYDYMKEQYGNVYYLGNVINSVEDAPNMEESERLIHERYDGRRLLFIGGSAYRPAALSLIQALEIYNDECCDLHAGPFLLDIIGMDTSLLPESEYVACHGYLNKDVEEQRNLYYQLIRSAMYVVNTSENWVGASSIIECAWHGLPFIITPNPDLMKTFGEKESCGFYSSGNSPEKILHQLVRAGEADFENYRKKSILVQQAVHEFTWDSYVKKILRLVGA